MKIGRSFQIRHSWLLWGPWLIFAIGFALNAVVMGANHGQMPVLLPPGDCALLDADDLIHGCMTHLSHLKFLGDWIVIRGVGIASPGDFFEWTQEIVWVPCLVTWFVLDVIKKK